MQAYIIRRLLAMVATRSRSPIQKSRRRARSMGDGRAVACHLYDTR
jgi:hypothetical protein